MTHLHHARAFNPGSRHRLAGNFPETKAAHHITLFDNAASDLSPWQCLHQTRAASCLAITITPAKPSRYLAPACTSTESTPYEN